MNYVQYVRTVFLFDLNNYLDQFTTNVFVINRLLLHSTKLKLATVDKHYLYKFCQEAIEISSFLKLFS